MCINNMEPIAEADTLVRAVTRPHMERVYRNIALNDRVQTYYWPIQQ